LSEDPRHCSSEARSYALLGAICQKLHNKKGARPIAKRTGIVLRIGLHDRHAEFLLTYTNVH